MNLCRAVVPQAVRHYRVLVSDVPMLVKAMLISSARVFMPAIAAKAINATTSNEILTAFLRHQ